MRASEPGISTDTGCHGVARNAVEALRPQSDSSGPTTALRTTPWHPTDAAERVPLLTPATDAAEAEMPLSLTPLATLLAGNVIPQGELIQLLLKPSRWFILLNSTWFALVTTLALAVLHVFAMRPMFISIASTVQLGLFLVAGRVMWATVQWMGRYYILTDLRVLRVSGIFAIDIQACALRKVQGVNFYSYIGERLLGAGCIETGGPEGKMVWQTVARPRAVHRMVAAAVARAQSNGCGPA